MLSLAELRAFDPKYTATKRGYRFCCPMCGSGKPKNVQHRSLWVDSKTGGWNCHRCLEKGLLFEWWQAKYPSANAASSKTYVSKSPFNRSNNSVQCSQSNQNQPNNYQSSTVKTIDEKKFKEITTDYQSYQKGFNYSPGQNYLASRGIDKELAISSGCGFGYWKHWIENEYGSYSLKKDKRVVFPIHNQEGQLIALSARAISSDSLEPKQIVKGYKSLGVFATPRALDSDTLIITEAPIDALSLAMAGFPAVATIGTSWPDWLVAVAAKKLTFIAFDNDEAGEKASLKLTAQLSGVGAKAERLLPSRKDWNEVLLTDGLEALKSQVDSFNLILNNYLPISNSSNTCDSYSLLSY